jgi:hypothetical protein
MNIVAIGAHPDDIEFGCEGEATLNPELRRPRNPQKRLEQKSTSSIFRILRFPRAMI